MKVLHFLALGGAGGIESLCVDIARSSYDDNFFYFLWGGGKNAEQIAKITSNIEIRNFKNKNFFSEYKSFENYCIENHIESIVVQGISPMMLIFAILIKKRYPKLKIVQYIHTDAKCVIHDYKRKILLKIVYHYCDGCIAISKYVKESVKEALGDNSKVHIIYNGVDIHKFSGTHTDSIDRAKVHLIYVGRLIQEKGVDNLLKALAIGNVMNYDLTIIGDGPYREQLENFSNKLKLDKSVKFVGTQWDIPLWLNKADLFVHPCNCNEGFGITLIEAMASGVPCVAFAKGAIPEVIDDGINGFLVQVCTIEDLADKLKEVCMLILNDGKRWLKIQNAARKKAESFSIKYYVENLSTYLHKL